MDNLRQSSCSEESSKKPQETLQEKDKASPSKTTTNGCPVDFATSNNDCNNNEYYSSSSSFLNINSCYDCPSVNTKDGPTCASRTENIVTSSAISAVHLGEISSIPSCTSPVQTSLIVSPTRSNSAAVLHVNNVSHNSSWLSSNGPMCRICHEGDSQEELISPCRCSGSMGVVHKHCLERWLTLSNCDKCELCRYVYVIQRTPRPFWQFMLCENQESRRSAVVDMACFFILTPLAILSLYLCISSTIVYANASPHKHKGHSRQKPVQWKTIVGRSIIKGARNATTDDGTNNWFLDNVIAWDIIGLVMLAFLLLGIYLSWLFACVIYHVRMWKRWRRVNQTLALAENHRRPSRFSIISSSYQPMEDGNLDRYSIASAISPVSNGHPTNAPFTVSENAHFLYPQNTGGTDGVAPCISNEKPLSASNNVQCVVVQSTDLEELNDKKLPVLPSTNTFLSTLDDPQTVNTGSSDECNELSTLSRCDS